MLTYSRLVRSSNRTFASITGMTKSDFDRLLPRFEEARSQCAPAQVRRRVAGGGAKPVLGIEADRLVFILFYFKLYPTQDLLGAMYGQTQPWANKWVQRLIPQLECALGKACELPARSLPTFEALIERCPDLRLILDATERPIPRPGCSERQQACYSGKKKRHTVKNTVLSSLKTKRILMVGHTQPGSIHDKRLLDEAPIAFPPGCMVYEDSGYQGHHVPNVRILRPKQKPRGGALLPGDKRRNQEIASFRVRVEHRIGGIKHFRILKDVFRNRKPGLDDKAIAVTSGLYNHRVTGHSISFG